MAISRGLGLSASVLVVAALSASAVEVDGVAAKIGQDTILRSDVIAEMRRMGAEDGSKFNEIRNEMIDRRLILQAAAEAKMSMQEWVVDNRVREIIQKAFGGDRNKLIDMLGRQKISFPEWRAKMKEDMVISAMRWNVVDKNAVASPSAMRKEYENHPERYSKGRKVSFSAIMLSPEDAGRKEEILSKLKEKTFEELGATTYRDVDPAEMFKPELVRELDSLPNGTISHWIEIGGWNYLFYKISETPGHSLPFDEAYEDIEAEVKGAEQKRLYDEWIERLRSETYIKVF